MTEWERALHVRMPMKRRWSSDGNTAFSGQRDGPQTTSTLAAGLREELEQLKRIITIFKGPCKNIRSQKALCAPQDLEVQIWSRSFCPSSMAKRRAPMARHRVSSLASQYLGSPCKTHHGRKRKLRAIRAYMCDALECTVRIGFQYRKTSEMT